MSRPPRHNERAIRIKAARNLFYEAAWKADKGRPDTALVSMAKWFAGKTTVECADAALQMYGGYGYFDEYKFQRIYKRREDPGNIRGNKRD